MYTQRSSGGSVFIPSNYRGNALYFEAPECEREEPKKEDENKSPPPPLCTQNKEKCSEGGPYASILSKVGGSDGILLIAVLAVLVLSCFGKKHECADGEDSSLDLLLVGVIAFLLLS